MDTPYTAKPAKVKPILQIEPEFLFETPNQGPPYRVSDYDQPSRVDEVDNWASVKKCLPSLDSGWQNRYGSLGGGSRADEKDNWSVGKKPLPARSPGFGSGFRDSGVELDRWTRGPPRDNERERPRLTLDPPKGWQNRYGSLGGGSRADEKDNWSNGKKPLPARSPGFGSGFRDSGVELDRWTRGPPRDNERERPRLTLDPPKDLQDGNDTYFVPAWSVTILVNWAKEVFNTAKVNNQTSMMVKKSNDNESPTDKLTWVWKPEAMKGMGKFKANQLQFLNIITVGLANYGVKFDLAKTEIEGVCSNGCDKECDYRGTYKPTKKVQLQLRQPITEMVPCGKEFNLLALKTCKESVDLSKKAHGKLVIAKLWQKPLRKRSVNCQLSVTREVFSASGIGNNATTIRLVVQALC
ncbi:hypothetical protein K1719_036295 [Acacia pycnantha]|nr:hypothetical protein K1719_036295 [Acacia pycnantha]